jgi:mycothiol synthase
LPEGVEVREVKPEHYHAIWHAEAEAFLDHWGAEPIDEEDYPRWLDQTPFQPHLWRVAWDGDEVVGMVRNYIDEESNARFNRKRGYTEDISVRRQWRRKGVARALIARSFVVHKEQGMTEAALSVDTENPNGALQLYESMGFEVTKRGAAYRKAME